MEREGVREIDGERGGGRERQTEERKRENPLKLGGHGNALLVLASQKQIKSNL